MKESTDIIPAELEALFDSLEYQENGSFTIERITFLERDIHFDFIIHIWYWATETELTQRWQLQIKNHENISVSTGGRTLYQGSRFYFYSDHLLLLPFSTNRTDIYTKKQPKDYQKLLAGIYEYHWTTLRNFISPEAFTGNIIVKVQLPYGLFASGPTNAMRRYFELLTEAGAEPYYYPPVPDNVLPPIAPDTYGGLTLAVLDGSTFIAPEFVFTRRE